MLSQIDIDRYHNEGKVPPLKEIEEWLARHHDLKETIDEMRRKAIGRKKLKCGSCGKATEIGKLTYIQTRWYVQPYSCNGGDYWKDGEGQYDCPKCGKRMRLYQLPEIEALKFMFGDLVYEDQR